jgi:hypothetical protein
MRLYLPVNAQGVAAGELTYAARRGGRWRPGILWVWLGAALASWGIVIGAGILVFNLIAG